MSADLDPEIRAIIRGGPPEKGDAPVAAGALAGLSGHRTSDDRQLDAATTPAQAATAPADAATAPAQAAPASAQVVVALFDDELSTVPQVVEVTWRDLVAQLGSPRAADTACDTASCAGKACLHKHGSGWSPARYAPGATRGNAGVLELTALVLDLDDVAPDRLDAICSALVARGCLAIVHGTHRDRPAGQRFVRIVVAISRPVPAVEWPRLWAAAVAHLELGDDVDPLADPSRLYFWPRCPKDLASAFLAKPIEGAPLDVDAVLASAPADLELPIVNVGDANVPEPEDEPAWLQSIPQADRVAAARAHLDRETGERKGESPRGMTWNVARSVARGYGVADLAVVVEAMREVYNPKCDPPWPDAKLVRFVEGARRAESPEWGAALRPWDPAERLGFTPDAMAAPPAPARVEIDAAIKAYCRRHRQSTRPEQIRIVDLLKRAQAGRALVEPGDDPATALAQAAAGLVDAAPAATTDQQLVDMLARSTIGTSPEALIAAIADARAALEVRAGAARAALEVSARAKRPIDSDSPPSSDDELRARLIPDRDGPKPCGTNIERILRWSSDTRDRLRFDVVGKKVVVGGGRFEIEAPNDLAVAITNWLGETWGLFASSGAVAEQLLRVARTWGRFDPVADYLNALVWDGVPRIDTWLARYCQAADTPYNRRVGAMWLISGAARGLKPGCKVDTVLVLEGKQGRKKSTAFNILGGEWFTDSPIDVHDKDSRALAAQKWVIELGELSSLRGNQIEAVKAFLSAQQDTFRPPYGRVAEDFDRHCVIAGTTNASEYLRDASGNRRFWCVEVRGVADEAGLRADRDQLWAEAAARYRAGERWWFDSDEQRTIADPVAADRQEENPFVGPIAAWLSRMPAPSADGWQLAEVANKALNIDVTEIDRHTRRLGEALRELGWSCRRVRGGGGGGGDRHRRWYPPGPGGAS